MSLGNQKVHLLRVLYAKLFDKRDKKRHPSLTLNKKKSPLNRI